MLLDVLLPWILLPASVARADQWPYDRYHAHRDKSGHFRADKGKPALTKEPTNGFVQWLHDVSKTQDSGAVRKMFVNDTIPRDLADIDELANYIEPPETKIPEKNQSYVLQPFNPLLPAEEAEMLLKNLNYPLDSRCTVDRSRWWYRTYDGSCNWLKKGEIEYGQVGTAKARDYNQHTFADGISQPREGPNPRAVSNAFFKRKKSIYYEHTPLLLGLIEFIMHDVTYSLDAPDDWIDVEMPPDEEAFSANTTFRVGRTQALPGTGTSKENPRENVNMASTWLDISSLYGSTPEVAKALRSFQNGKLLTQELKTAGRSTYSSYLPFNSMKVPMNTRPGIDAKTLFAGGDPRTNEDWLLLGVHTLLLREHNRLCDILSRQHPEYDDERLYQTIRLVMGGKYAMIANAYQMAYWTDKMPWPRDDGYPLYRQMYGKNSLEINPMNTYPWPLVTKGGKPMVVSAEMSVVYRFHEFIIPDFPIIDNKNQILRNQSVFKSAFNPKGFIEAGLDNVLRGTVGTHIPNFKSGVDENFRSAGVYRGRPFDIVTWSIVHEREQGLPTFNQYFRAYSQQDPAVIVPARKRFEDFSTDKETVEKLKKLYKTPDEVDLVVGVQLDEEFFPGTTVPKSALIISLFSLFGMGNSDRFSVGYAVSRCLLVDSPWDCKPSNALEDLLWAPKPNSKHPNFRWFDTFWLNELDFPAHGANLLWRLVTENTDIRCLQQRPLFPADPKTNPVLCALPKTTTWSAIENAVVSGSQAALSFYRRNPPFYNTILFALLSFATYKMYQNSQRERKLNKPPVLGKWIPVLGEGIALGKDAKGTLLRGFADSKNSASKVFGMKLAQTTHFFITKPVDIALMIADNPDEARFNLRSMYKSINMDLITGQENFDSNLHNKLVARHLTSPDPVAKLSTTALRVSQRFVRENIKPGHSDSFVTVLMSYITFVSAGMMVGPEALGNPDLLKLFADFNDDAFNTLSISGLLPKFLKPLAGLKIKSDYKRARKMLTPIIESRRAQAKTKSTDEPNLYFLDFILEAVEDDMRVSVMDIVNMPMASTERAKLFSVSTELSSPDLISATFPVSSRPDPRNPWTYLRSAMFESIRLCGQIMGPSRKCEEDIILPSSLPADGSSKSFPQTIPKDAAATLSAYYINRSEAFYGPSASTWDPARFQESDPAIGTHKYVSWGLENGPHHCPGRWFAQACILVMTAALFNRWDIEPDQRLSDGEKYLYGAAGTKRRDVGVTFKRRS